MKLLLKNEYKCFVYFLNGPVFSGYLEEIIIKIKILSKTFQKKISKNFRKYFGSPCDFQRTARLSSSQIFQHLHHTFFRRMIIQRFIVL